MRYVVDTRVLAQVVKGACKNIVADLFIMIEGQSEDELPERVSKCLPFCHSHLCSCFNLRHACIFMRFTQLSGYCNDSNYGPRSDDRWLSLCQPRLEQLQVCDAASTPRIKDRICGLLAQVFLVRISKTLKFRKWIAFSQIY